MKAVILCGGSGTRLWPISTKEKPKQFHKIFNGKSLFEMTIERNTSLCSEVQVISNQDHLDHISQQLPTNINAQIVLEPIGRNTSGAIALSAFNSEPEDILLVFPSDHIIENDDLYSEAINEAKKLAEDNKLVTFGIKPSYPETGYGYIQHQKNDVLSFKEKPASNIAEKYIKEGNYLWNSGMFCFKACEYLKSLKEFAPEVFNAAQKVYELQNKKDNIVTFVKEEMQKIPSISIDYAVMENANNIAVVPSTFSWNDLGSFDSLSNLITNNIKNTFEINSNNNTIISNSKNICTVGVDDLIIVENGDNILIVKKGESQSVKQIYELIKENKPQQV